jgi:2'-5' RNA ligase
MKRLFAAVRITPGDSFMKVYNGLKQPLRNEHIKWVDPGNIHVTLKFFGETPEEKIPAISAMLDNIAGRYKPFTIRLQKVGIFGSAYQPRVIWFGIENGASLVGMANDTIRKAEETGFESDRQNFVPHLTIGRIKNIRDKKNFQAVVDKYRDSFIQDQPVGEMILFESILRPQGPLYVPLVTCSLRGTA